MRTRRPIARLLAGAATAAALAASPAAAQEGHSLALAGPSSATVGQPATLQASGTVPGDVFLNRYLNVYAIPTTVVASCPATFQNAIDLSYNSSAQGGDTVTAAVPAEGSFTIPVAYAPRVRGQFLLCGYLHEGVDTMATAQHTVGVSAPGGGDGSDGGPAGPGSGSAKPANLSRPRVQRSGRKLTCSRGAWSGAPTAYTYRWLVAGKRKAGATRRTLRITRAMRGRVVRCRVTATNAAGKSTELSPSVRVRRKG
jgi:hypothetical protein